MCHHFHAHVFTATEPDCSCSMFDFVQDMYMNKLSGRKVNGTRHNLDVIM